MLLVELQATTAQLSRLAVLRNRVERSQARDDRRQWMQDRRARTRHLIELVDDDRATMLGALLDVAAQLRNGSDDGTSPVDLRARWRRRGLRAFDADRETLGAEAGGQREEGGMSE